MPNNKGGGVNGKITVKKLKIKKELRLSSLGIAQLICEIEDKFDIDISARDLISFKTVQDLVDYLEEKTK